MSWFLPLAHENSLRFPAPHALPPAEYALNAGMNYHKAGINAVRCFFDIISGVFKFILLTPSLSAASEAAFITASVKISMFFSKKLLSYAKPAFILYKPNHRIITKRFLGIDPHV